MNAMTLVAYSAMKVIALASASTTKVARSMEWSRTARWTRYRLAARHYAWHCHHPYRSGSLTRLVVVLISTASVSLPTILRSRVAMTTSFT